MIDDLVEQIEARFAALEAELADPEVIGDRQRFTAASRAYRDLEPAARLASEYRRVATTWRARASCLAEDGADSELRALLESSRERVAALEEEIRLAMVRTGPQRRQERDRRDPSRGPGARRPRCGPATCTAC